MKVKKFKLQSIKFKLVAILLLICLVPVAVMGATIYLKSKSALRSKLETTSKQTILEVNRGIDNYFKGVSNLVELISNNIDIKSIDENKEHFEFGKALLANIKNVDKDIITIHVATEKGSYYACPEDRMDTDFDYKSRPWYKLAMENKGQVVVTEPFVSTIDGKNVVTIAKIIEKDNKVIGVVAVSI